jgi:hypothetical protein
MQAVSLGFLFQNNVKGSAFPDVLAPRRSMLSFFYAKAAMAFYPDESIPLSLVQGVTPLPHRNEMRTAVLRCVAEYISQDTLRLRPIIGRLPFNVRKMIFTPLPPSRRSPIRPTQPSVADAATAAAPDLVPAPSPPPPPSPSPEPQPAAATFTAAAPSPPPPQAPSSPQPTALSTLLAAAAIGRLSAVARRPAPLPAKQLVVNDSSLMLKTLRRDQDRLCSGIEFTSLPSLLRETLARPHRAGVLVQPGRGPSFVRELEMLGRRLTDTRVPLSSKIEFVFVLGT